MTEEEARRLAAGWRRLLELVERERRKRESGEIIRLHGDGEGQAA